MQVVKQTTPQSKEKTISAILTTVLPKAAKRYGMTVGALKRYILHGVSKNIGHRVPVADRRGVIAAWLAMNDVAI